MTRIAILAIVCCSTIAAFGADWPQFRGPAGQGHSDASNLPTTWSERENVVWKTAIPGKGWSSPVIMGHQIWLTTALENGKSLRAICVDRESGKILQNIELFQVAEPPSINAKNSYASPTPVLDAGHVYVHFGTLGTACIDREAARILWKNEELNLDHKEGAGSSPILWHDLLIVNCDGIDVQYVVALDKRTGKIVWKTDRPGPMPDNTDFRKAYSTPLAVRVHGRDQLISTGAHQVIGYDPATGKPLWRVRFDGFSNVPRPVFGDDLLFICTGYMKPQLWAIKLGTDDVKDENVLWRVTKQVPANPSPLLVRDRLYMISDQGIATCLVATTGKELWKHRLSGTYSASPILADDHIYFCSEQGATSIVQPDDTFESLGTSQLEGQIMASPVALGQAIYLRTDTHLYRIEKINPRTALRASLN